MNDVKLERLIGAVRFTTQQTSRMRKEVDRARDELRRQESLLFEAQEIEDRACNELFSYLRGEV